MTHGGWAATERNDRAVAGPIASRLWNRLITLWSARRWPSTAHAVVACALLAVIGWMTLFLGALHNNTYNVHDTFIFLDGAWRVLSGQRPHVDFYTGLGFVSYWLFALGLLVGNGDPNGIGLVRAVIGVGLTLWAYWLLKGRMRLGPLLLCCATLLLLVVSPFPLGKGHTSRSLAMFYNRYGYALCGLVLLECFAADERQPPEGRKTFGYGLSSGFALAVLAFVKITFFVVGAGFVAASLLSNGIRRARLAGLAVGFSAIAAIGLWYLRFDVSSFLGDLRFIAAARSAGFFLGPAVAGAATGAVGAAALMALSLCLLARERGGDRWRLVRWLLIPLLTIGAGAVLLVSNSQAFGYPLNGLAMALLLDDVRLGGSGPAKGKQTAVVLLAGVVALNLLIQMRDTARDAVGLGRAFLHQVRHAGAPGVARIQAAGMDRLVIEGSHADLRKYQTGSEYVRVINDGIGLLRAHSRDDESVIALEFTNPFSVSLRRPPAGGANYFAIARNISRDRMLPAERMFRGAALVMIPKFQDSEYATTDLLESHYADALRAWYRPAAESEFWRLYRRDPAAGIVP